MVSILQDWITLSEAARAYGVDRHVTRSAAERGLVHSTRVFGNRLIYIPDLIRWRRSISENRIRGRRFPLWDLRTGIGRAEALRSISETANKLSNS